MIRPATPNDAPVVLELMYTAIGDIAHAFTGTNNKEQALLALRPLFEQTGNRISYENIFVEEREDQVIGFVLAYHGSQIASLDAPLIERVRQRGQDPSAIIPEAREDEYYLDSLAVDSSYQGQGIGTVLIHAFEQQAQQLGHHKVMLIVDQENPKARKLYERLGYTEDGQITVNGHEFYRMIKAV
ncbi:GNAT family N-acetyltransferase [Paenibacillus nicotianae]|uniref:GNAT family N-acetyltransferase n=1 Tax=Paenibacillus nicotianae TaxID=1526551 RepID=A0ABW4UP14_9BACL